MTRPTDRLVLIGGGEHALVVHEAATLAGARVRGAIAPQVHEPLLRLGDDHQRDQILQPGDRLIAAWCGQPGSAHRQHCIQDWTDAGPRWGSVVHPTAWVSLKARIGVGVFIGAGAIVQAEADIGDHAIINSGAVVEHHCRIGTGVHLAPAAVLGGGCTVGAWTWIGLGARIRDHLHIHQHAIVAMGAVVVADVDAHTTVLGCPARAYGNPGSPRRQP